MFLSFWSDYMNFFIVLGVTLLAIVIAYLVFMRIRKNVYESEDLYEEVKAPKPTAMTIEENPTPESQDVVEIITHVAENRTEDAEEDSISSNLEEDQAKENVKETAEPESVETIKKEKTKSDFDILEEKLKSVTSKKVNDEDDEDEIEGKSALEEALSDDDDEDDKKSGKRYHVLYRKEDNKWYVKREGTERITRVLETQKEAIAFATIKAINQHTTVVVHKRDGKIRKYSL